MIKRPYFLGGITARGFVYFYDNLISKMDHILYLDGGMTSINQSVFKTVLDYYSDSYEVECVHNHVEPDQLEAVIFPELSVAIIDRAKVGPQSVLTFPKLIEDVFYIGEGYDYEHLRKNKKELTQLQKKIDQYYNKTKGHFESALNIHHQVEQTYFQYMNIDKANNETEKLIESFFKNSYLNKPSRAVHRYLGAATSEGPQDFILDLTDDLDRRIFIKGRSGTGKSTMLKRLVKEAEHRGFDLEIYHCGFDPDSLDMVVLREIGLAIFDATAPHEHNPMKTSDEIFDSYELFVEGNPDSKEKDKITDLEANYKQKMKNATKELNHIRTLQREFETIYQQAMDEKFMDRIASEAVNWINQYANKS
ncbi:hypothetical protein ACLIA0_05060 [Bacillaceae bacterium W0354]